MAAVFVSSVTAPRVCLVCFLRSRRVPFQGHCPHCAHAHSYAYLLLFRLDTAKFDRDETLSLASDESADDVHPTDRVSLVGSY